MSSENLKQLLRSQEWHPDELMPDCWWTPKWRDGEIRLDLRNGDCRVFWFKKDKTRWMPLSSGGAEDLVRLGIMDAETVVLLKLMVA